MQSISGHEIHSPVSTPQPGLDTGDSGDITEDEAERW